MRTTKAPAAMTAASDAAMTVIRCLSVITPRTCIPLPIARSRPGLRRPHDSATQHRHVPDVILTARANTVNYLRQLTGSRPGVHRVILPAVSASIPLFLLLAWTSNAVITRRLA